MKLTLAMGLQFDNNKAANMYALSIGQGSQSTMPVPVDAIAEHAVRLEQPLAVIPQSGGSPFFLTYNLNGLPDTMMFDTQLDVFV